MSEATRILKLIDQGDPSAASKLLPLVYDELRRLAAARLANEKSDHTLDATALVHEAYLRLVALGLHQFDKDHRHLPAVHWQHPTNIDPEYFGQPDPQGDSYYFSWTARTLPYLEQQQTYNKIDFEGNATTACGFRPNRKSDPSRRPSSALRKPRSGVVRWPSEAPSKAVEPIQVVPRLRSRVICRESRHVLPAEWQDYNKSGAVQRKHLHQ